LSDGKIETDSVADSLTYFDLYCVNNCGLEPPKKEKDMTNHDRFMYRCYLNIQLQLGIFTYDQVQRIMELHPWLEQPSNVESQGQENNNDDDNDDDDQFEGADYTKETWDPFDAGFTSDPNSVEEPSGWD